MVRYQKFEDKHYQGACEVLTACGFEVLPSSEELLNVAIVAIKDSKVIGIIWVCTNGHSAYFDYFAVHPDFRGDPHFVGHKDVATTMCLVMLTALKSMQIKKFYGAIESEHLAKTLNFLGSTVRSTKYVLSGDVNITIEAMKASIYGK